MRYLWVEDFGGDQQDRGDKLAVWKNYFGVDFDRECLKIASLEEAMEYLDGCGDPGHGFNFEFDAVLLDIRFPVRRYGSRLSDDRAVYDQWFQDIISYKVFSDYTLASGCNASSGILLFHALIRKYRYDWRKIAFISANVDHGEMYHVSFLEQTLARIQYNEEWDLIDSKETVWIEYRSQYWNICDDIDESDSEVLRELLKGITCVAPSELRKLKETHDLGVIQRGLEGLGEIRRQKNHDAFDMNNNDLKYSSVFGHFEKLTAETPPVFAKPSSDSGRCWTFLVWRKTLKNDIKIGR